MFVGSLVAVMGFVGLATEGGMWYGVRRNAQNAADAAAIAGALAMAQGGADADAVQVGKTLATLNGFTAGAGTTVTVTPLATTGGSGYRQVKAVVSEQMVPLLSSLFIGTSPVVGATATAGVQSVGTACALSLASDMVVSGTANSILCTFASNATSPTAMNVTGIAKVASLNTAGGCCGAGTVTVSGRPVAAFQPPAINPYVAADTAALPGFTAATCDPVPGIVGGQINMVPYETSHRAYCSSTIVNGAPTWQLAAAALVKFVPGTYFFQETSIDWTTGTVQCAGTCINGTQGVTIVLTGGTGNIGTLTIGQNARITLVANSAPAVAALKGLLFYGRGLSAVSLNLVVTGTIPSMRGGLYFPNANMVFTGNATGSGASTCLMLMARSVTFMSSSRINWQSCATFGTALPQTQAVRLVQ
jgi:hypothetical protein